MAEWQTNSIAADYVWQVVNAALDGLEQHMAEVAEARANVQWVILRDGRPVAVAPTRSIARRWVKERKAATKYKLGLDGVFYTLHQVDTVEPIR